MELTKEQEVKIEELYQSTIKNGLKQNVETELDRADIEWLYQTYFSRSAPEQIEKVDSPEAALQAAGLDHTSVGSICFLNWYTWWMAHYSGGIHILNERDGVEQELIDELDKVFALAHKYHGLLCCEEACFVVEFPSKISLKDNDIEKFSLHDTTDFAVKYRDGTGFGWINGIEVLDYLVTTPHDKLDPKQILAERDTDVRREGLKLVGLNRALEAINAKVLDSSVATQEKPWNEYELIEADFGDDKLRRFLKMKNPSTGEYVIEQVDISCNTIAEANAFQCRETVYIEPAVIT